MLQSTKIVHKVKKAFAAPASKPAPPPEPAKKSPEKAESEEEPQ